MRCCGAAQIVYVLRFYRNGRDTWECLGDYRHIGKLLRDNFLVDTYKPLFIITDKAAVQPRELRLVEMSLKMAGFQVMWQSDDTRDLPREARAILYYFLAMEAEVFIGNHVSTLSALLIIHRRGLGRCSPPRPAIAIKQLQQMK